MPSGGCVGSVSDHVPSGGCVGSVSDHVLSPVVAVYVCG